MEAVYRFLATYEGLIYILLSLGGLFAFRWLWKSWREWRNSVFGLEREFAVRRLSQALMVSLLIRFLVLWRIISGVICCTSIAFFWFPGDPHTRQIR